MTNFANLYQDGYPTMTGTLPGHLEITSNKVAQIWNNLKLNNAKSIACVRASALVWYWKNPQS